MRKKQVYNVNDDAEEFVDRNARGLMNLQKSLERIIELFGMFRLQVQSYNKAGLFDINTLSEDIFVPIFQELFDVPFLRNLNAGNRNTPGVDLGDDRSKVAFQITSDSGIDKIKDALQKVVKHEQYRKYETIYVYILTQKQAKYSAQSLKSITKGHFTFDARLHILDSTDVIERCRHADLAVVQRIETILEVHLTNAKRYFISATNKSESESLTLGLVPIHFPAELFIGRVTFDRERVIEESRNRDLWLSHTASQRRIVQAALEQKGLKFSSAWVSRKNEIITFHDLRDEMLPLSAVIDSSTVDPMPTSRFIEGGNAQPMADAVSIVKDLLRSTLQAQLWHRGITWQHEERLFMFVSRERRKVDGKEIVIEPRFEQWSRGKKSGRMVYRIKWWNDDPSKYWYHEHMAFAVSFDVYEGKWYMAIRPEVFCSKNGYEKSKFHKNRSSFLKRKAHNLDVIDDLQFIVEILQKDQAETLLIDSPQRVLTFGDLVRLDGAPIIRDADWLQQEEKRKRKALERPPEEPLFDIL